LSTKPEFVSPGTKPILRPNYVDVHEANLPHKHIGFIYFAKAESDAAKLSDEHTELKWFSEAELYEEAYELDKAIIFYAEQALQTARNS
jgi:hypothetical protein